MKEERINPSVGGQQNISLIKATVTQTKQCRLVKDYS